MRSIPGWVYVLVLIGVVSIAAGIPYLVASDDARRPANEEAPTTLPGVQLSNLQEARVEEVIDGDTIDVNLNGRRVRIRYYGIDTPERGDRCYREAVDRNEQLVGDRVLLLPDARDTDPNGRSLRYVFRPDGVSIDATLVAEGFANAWREDGRYRSDIIALEREAQAEGRGCLW
jgi:endonuclease YncB( thermonuclease family)